MNDKIGIEAVRDGLKNNGFYSIAKEDEPDINLLNNLPIKVTNSKTEEYYPFIEITKSPLSLRLILPALDSIKILELVTKLYKERFRKGIGKLPLNTGLLVSKRKFPLYVLLDAGERTLNDEIFKKPEEMDSWYDITELEDDKYYGFYPVKKLSGNDKYYTLDELASLSKGKHFTLYPGYFDFDLLLATTDRYKINYESKKRTDEDYRLLSSRPYYFYQISQMVYLWEILYNNISISQINFIEEMFNRKLIEWRNNPDKEIVFREFIVATLKDAFAKKWSELRVETRDFLINSALNRLLLDTIILFRHAIKVKEVNENE